MRPETLEWEGICRSIVSELRARKKSWYILCDPYVSMRLVFKVKKMLATCICIKSVQTCRPPA